MQEDEMNSKLSHNQRNSRIGLIMELAESFNSKSDALNMHIF